MANSVSPTVRYSCQITTVDPAQGIIEAAVRGKIISISTFVTPVAFRWPVVGETWIVHQMNGSWYLEGLMPSTTATTDYHTISPGDAIINSSTGVVHVLGSEDNTDFDLFYNTSKDVLAYSYNGQTTDLTIPNPSSFDPAGAAATAQSNAETYAAQQASTAQNNAETYVNQKIAALPAGMFAPYATSAYYDGSPAIPSLGQNVPFDVIDYVAGAAQTSDWISLNSNSTAWVCPLGGVYSFKGAVDLTSNGSVTFRAIAQLLVNGSVSRRCSDREVTTDAPARYPTLPVAADIRLSTGDRVQLQIYVSASSACTFSGDTFGTFLGIDRVA